MFTGIIKETGRINKIKDKTFDREIGVRCNKILKDLCIGDSIAVSGVCLTVTNKDSQSFSCDVSFNTLNNTSLKHLKIGNVVNLESSLTVSDKLGGHFVSGHVDCTAKILNISKTGRSYIVDVELPPDICDYIVPNGSVAIEGISLTITGVQKNSFRVVIIPYTFENTNLSEKRVGDIVNIEIDILARYVINFLKSDRISNTSTSDISSRDLKDKILKEKLRENGFIAE
ncbi:MAG: riboflavin synthase [Actinomycetota bacterium]|nr:riboflavin synthase [Actinomycetota bacterium]